MPINIVTKFETFVFNAVFIITEVRSLGQMRTIYVSIDLKAEPFPCSFG